MRCYKMLFAFSLVCLCTANLLAQSESKNAEQEKINAEMIAGTWTVVKGMKAGAESDAEMLAQGGVKLTEEEFSMPSGTGEDFVMAYTIDNSHDPAHIDMTITAGPVPESMAQGIIAMKDGKLMLCYQPMGGDRPTAFESDSENGNHMFVMKRQGMDATAIQGTWHYASGKRAGQESPAERLAGDVVITDETFTLPGSPEQNFVMEYELDTSTSPAGIVLEIKEGPVADGRAVGIIKMDGDNLVLCYDPTGATAPESFESTEDNGFFLFVLKPAED